jgi:hypothetical protein
LIEILRRKAADAGLWLTPEAERQAEQALDRTRRQAGASFGNARTVEKLLRKMESHLARRTFGLPDDAGDEVLGELRAEDVPDVAG